MQQQIAEAPEPLTSSNIEVGEKKDNQVTVLTPGQYRRWKIENREKWAEWYRLYFHTLASSLCLFISGLLGYSGIIVYLSHLNHSDGSPTAALSLFINHPPQWICFVLGMFYIPLDSFAGNWTFFFVTLFPAATWLYTTITQPIKKRYKTVVSWKSPKGRIAAFLISAFSFMAMYCGFMGWYVDTNMFDFFSSIESPAPYLSVNSMRSFGYILLYLPVVLCLYGIYITGKQFYQLEDLRKQFLTFEFSPISRQSFNLTDGKCDVIVGWNKKTRKPIVIKETNRMLHELVVGATGSGKSSTAILIRIVQDLIRIARGQKLGVVVLEPKGDLVNDVLSLCKKLGIPESKIKVVDPLNMMRSIKFNPLQGEKTKVAETFKGTLNALAGDQDAFFKGQQEETAGFYVLLGKIMFKEKFDIYKLQQMFTDAAYLAEIVERVHSRIEREMNDPATTKARHFELIQEDNIVRYFENEVLNFRTYRKDGMDLPLVYPAGHRYEGRQQVESKKDGYITGGKKYLNELAMNQLLSRLFIPEEGEETLDLDKFLDEGGVLVVNTALGDLDEMSLLFGQFFIRQFQSAVFRRPPEVDENGDPTGYIRIPIFFTVDEFPLYINEAFERMLTLGRSYKVGTLIAIQSLGQLDSVRPGYDKVIKTNARNKTVFGGGEIDDNEWFSRHFGEEPQIEESMNESTTPVTVENQTWGFRYNTQRSLVARFSPTDIKELPFKHFIIELINEDNSIQPPVLAYGKFVSETKYLKKFINIGKEELVTEKDSPFTISSHLHYYKQAISSTLENGPSKSEEKHTIEGEPVVVELPPAVSNDVEEPIENEDPTKNYLPTSQNQATQDETSVLPNTTVHQAATKIETKQTHILEIDNSCTVKNEETFASESSLSTQEENKSEKPIWNEDNDELLLSEKDINAHYPGEDPIEGEINHVDSKEEIISEEEEQEDIREQLENEKPASHNQSPTFESKPTHSKMEPEQEKQLNQFIKEVQKETHQMNQGNQEKKSTGPVIGLRGFGSLKGDDEDLKNILPSMMNGAKEIAASTNNLKSEDLATKQTTMKMGEEQPKEQTYQQRHAAASIDSIEVIEEVEL